MVAKTKTKTIVVTSRMLKFILSFDLRAKLVAKHDTKNRSNNDLKPRAGWFSAVVSENKAIWFRLCFWTILRGNSDVWVKSCSFLWSVKRNLKYIQKNTVTIL